MQSFIFTTTICQMTSGRKKKSPLLPQESISVFAGLKKETFCLYSEAMISFVPCIWMLALYLMCLVVFS